MKRKNIEAMREVRLWIAQIIVPAAIIVTTRPEVVEALKKLVDKNLFKGGRN